MLIHVEQKLSKIYFDNRPLYSGSYTFIQIDLGKCKLRGKNRYICNFTVFIINEIQNTFALTLNITEAQFHRRKQMEEMKVNALEVPWAILIRKKAT